MSNNQTPSPDLFQDHSAQDSVPATEQLTARQVALDLLDHVLNRKQALDHSLESSSAFHDLPARDKAFCRMLTTTVIRRLGQIDALIIKAADSPSRTSPVITNILRMGIAQIAFMAVADHAAVDTSVRLAEAAGMVRQKGFINAMLRTITREGKDWLAKQDETRLNTPEWLLKIWIDDYGLRGAANIAKANLAEAPLDISVKNKDELEYWQSALNATPLGNNTLRRNSGGNVTELEGFSDGRWWIQDLSAALPAGLFGALHERSIVDMCAAPGGKTMQLAAQGAHVIALDRSAKRLQKLQQNAQRLHIEDKIDIQATDATAWTPRQAPDFILLDAPCSATGTVRRNPDVLHQKSPRDIEHLTRVQGEMLRHAYNILAPGGLLVYCTCSLQKSEGEDQIARFLSQTPSASKIAISANEIGGLEECITEEGDVRALPYHMAQYGGMDGFFISRITKNA